ncbi:MAG TPA: adenosylcobinamide-GDP ribazoletransferase [Chloroflexota bacterium]|nr:adenosylcobinamide-GDP ribazoletransferase [Chloroflexota bacterium]
MLAAPWLEVRCALGLLTRLPVDSPERGRSGSATFGLVGAGLGAVAALPALLVGDRSLLGAALALGVLALVSGALHLDGLADTADALAAVHAEAAQRALRDPAVGAAGASAIAIVLFVQAGSLSSVPPAALLPSLLVAGAVSRAVPAIAAPWLPRLERGFGAWFAAHSGRGGAAVALVTSLAVAVLVGPGWGAISWFSGLAAGLALLGLLTRRLGAVSGDGYGAAVEISFAASLVASAFTP